MVRYQRLNVVIEREGLCTPFGFRLQGGIDFDCPLIIEQVTFGEPSMQLKPDDRLLMIQGQDSSNLTHYEATKLICKAGHVLHLTILRPIISATLSGNQIATSCYRKERQKTDDKSERMEPIPSNYQLAGLMKSALNQQENDGRWSPSLSKIKNTTTGQRRGPTMQSLRLTGRNTPTVVEMNRNGRNDVEDRPEAVGLWTSPTGKNVELIHRQYNSPGRMYTPDNVADMIEKQTGAKLTYLSSPQCKNYPSVWKKKPSVRFLEDMTDSPTYRYLQELAHPRRARSVEPTQSTCLRNLSRFYQREGTMSENDQ